MTDGISSKTCYTKLNFDFSYVRFLSLRRDPYDVAYKNFVVASNVMLVWFSIYFMKANPSELQFIAFEKNHIKDI